MSFEEAEGLVAALRRARAIVVLTGAGISAESGIPTFRDSSGGLWAHFDPMKMATPEGFARDPAGVTRWYDERLRDLAACRPNAGHRALALLERRAEELGRAFALITQNVDRLHQAAGSRNVVELHGSIQEWRCTGCGVTRRRDATPFSEYPPRCACGGLLRPDVVWFGEPLPARALRESERAIAGCDLFLSVGTSASVYPAAGFLHAARARGARTAEINREETPISGLVDWALRGRAGEILPRIVEAAFGAGGSSHEEGEAKDQN